MEIFKENSQRGYGLRYTEEGKELQKDINDVLCPIFEKWTAKGMSIDKINYIIDHIKLDIQLNYMLGL